MRRVAALLVVVASLTFQTYAAADFGNQDNPPPEPPSNDVGYDEGQVGVYAGYDASENPIREVGGPIRGRTAPRIVCWLANGTDLVDPGGIAGVVVRSPREGLPYLLMCRRGDAAPEPVRIVIYEPGDPTDGEIVTETQVTDYMLSLFQFDLPDVVPSPAADAQVVNVETWIGFPSNPSGQTRTAQAGPLWSQGEAEATSMVITWGNGETTTCGVFEPAYNPDIGDLESQRPTCARYTFEQDSRDQPNEVFAASVTVTYDIWVTTSDNATPALAATVDGPTLAIDLDVAELQAVIR